MEGKTCSLTFNPYFLRDGLIVNEFGENVFTTRRFDDAIDADYWLNFVSDDGRFDTAYIEKDESRGSILSRPLACPHRNRSEATLSALQNGGADVTLDNWLLWNGIDLDDAPDAELLEIIPAEFQSEYEKRFETTEDNDEQS
jgi:hypothetical protein